MVESVQSGGRWLLRRRHTECGGAKLRLQGQRRGWLQERCAGCCGADHARPPPPAVQQGRARKASEGNTMAQRQKFNEIVGAKWTICRRTSSVCWFIAGRTCQSVQNGLMRSHAVEGNCKVQNGDVSPSSPLPLLSPFPPPSSAPSPSLLSSSPLPLSAPLRADAVTADEGTERKRIGLLAQNGHGPKQLTAAAAGVQRHFRHGGRERPF